MSYIKGRKELGGSQLLLQLAGWGRKSDDGSPAVNGEKVAFQCPRKEASKNNVFIETSEMYRS